MQVKQSAADSKESLNVKSHNSSNRQKSSSKMKYYLIALTLGILGFTVITRIDDIQIFGNRVIDDISTSFSLNDPIYVIIIDAGSTASRVNVFDFHYSLTNSVLILDDSLFYETKPGLSSFAKKPSEVAKSLKILLDKAKSKIPKDRWASTPMSLRATAGLRLLPESQAQNIIEECKRVFASSGFKVNDQSVSIMDGTDEGIFSWFTTNFLLNKFAGLEKTVAAFDLGGGSTQTTFAVKPEQLSSSQAKNLHPVSVSNRNVSVFTNSFLGMGLMAARKAIITHSDKQSDQMKTKSNYVELSSVCVNPTNSGTKWNYAGKDYLISKSVGQSYGFSKCLEVVKKVVASAIPNDLPSLRDQEIYAFSYYFELAEEVR